MRSRVVYKYTCQCCGALYFGQTLHHLHTRISEHMGVSPLTGKKLATTSLSSIQAHIHHTHHTIPPNDFSIISSCHSSSNFEFLIRESLLISKFISLLLTKTSHPNHFLYSSYFLHSVTWHSSLVTLLLCRLINYSDMQMIDKYFSELCYLTFWRCCTLATKR